MQNQFHVSQSTLDAMLLLAGKKDIRYYLNGLNIEWNSEITRVIACDGHKLGIFQAAAPDKYPDFRRVVNPIQTSGTSGVAGGFNLEYLNQFEKCGNLLAGRKLSVGNRLRLHHNGDGAALVLLLCVDGFAGVVMPIRDSVGYTGALFPVELTSDLAGQPAAEPVAA
jgi:hypothetical protein